MKNYSIKKKLAVISFVGVFCGLFIAAGNIYGTVKWTGFPKGKDIDAADRLKEAVSEARVELLLVMVEKEPVKKMLHMERLKVLTDSIVEAPHWKRWKHGNKAGLAVPAVITDAPVKDMDVSDVAGIIRLLNSFSLSLRDLDPDE